MSNNPFMDLLIPAHYEAWNDFVTAAYPEQWFEGGRGSMKSTTAGYFIVAGIMAAEPGTHAFVTRNHKEELRGSVYNEIATAISRLNEAYPEHNIASRWRFRTSPMDITYANGNSIVFHGLDEAGKKKSIRPPEGGYFRYLWMEEFDQYGGMDEVRSLRLSVLRGKIGQSIYSFNPPQSTNAWVNAESLRQVPGRKVYHTSYLDVAKYHPEWLGPAFLREAEEMKAANPTIYEHTFLGKATGTGGEIFTNVHEERITDEQIETWKAKGMVRRGLDFGFTNDPCALVQSAYDRDTKTIYIFDEWYKRGQFTDGILEAIQRRGLTDAVIIADRAEPRVIGELRYRGCKRLHECWKSPDGWREDGMRWLRSRVRIVIDSRRCPHAWEEFTRYEYKRFASGELRTDYPDGNDHTIDAVRYGHESDIREDCMKRHVGVPHAIPRRI